uniref:Uncharacterized protein n=1 Tax=Arundo donax TaxID=35708 RepID=A0A0A9A1F7_ARUDO
MTKKCSDSSIVHEGRNLSAPLYPGLVNDASMMDPVKSALFIVAEKPATIHDEASSSKIFCE